jgi:hypothetical protein
MSCFSAKGTRPTVAEPDPTKHVNYNLGMVLGVDDFTQEFAYLSGRDQWLARDLIGYGTVRGLRVGIEEDTEKGPRVVVEPGVAISPRGQLICVPSAQCAYLKDFVESRPDEVNRELGSSPASRVQLYIMLCYRDCPTDSVPIAGEPCRNEDDLMAPSRLTDSFSLELRFKKPNQREDDAVRDYVKWLKQVEVDGTITSTPLESFLGEIRSAARPWFGSPLSSPPSSPPSDFMFGSPTSRINSADLCEYMRAAFRIWVTELRPKWIARWHGCAATHFDVNDRSEEDCVLLAELTVPIVPFSPGHLTVADTPDVTSSERSRPFVAHLRMLQEWLGCGPCCESGSTSSAVEHPPGLAPYRIVAAGIVGGAGAAEILARARAPRNYNGLRVLRTEDGTFVLTFDGYRPPDRTFQYIVKALPVSPGITNQLSVTFVGFRSEGFIVRLTVSGRVSAALLQAVQLMVEVSEASGALIR